MKYKYLKTAFTFILLSFVFDGCTYKHDGKIVKDTKGNIYKLKGNGRTSEAYHLEIIDTTNYKKQFR